MNFRAIVASFIAAILLTVTPVASTESTKVSPHVIVESMFGQGSGTYIGNGYILTALHVAPRLVNYSVKFHNGERLSATVVVQNFAFDFAVLRLDSGIVNVDPAPLLCDAVAPVDAHIKLYGNPGMDPYLLVEDVVTHGQIAGKPFKVDNNWTLVIPTDAPVAWGMSGGGAINDEGQLVGVTVGIWLAQRDAVGMSMIVPSYLVCNHLRNVGIDLG